METITFILALIISFFLAIKFKNYYRVFGTSPFVGISTFFTIWGTFMIILYYIFMIVLG